MDHRLLELLVCPICKAPLDLWRASGPDGVDELFCRADRLAYPIRDGIPVMLENEARATDSPETSSAP